MFKKSNPNAFLHTAHYLLNIIDKGNFKSKFEWPLYEKRMETTFRNTFRSFMTELNDVSTHSLSKYCEQYIYLKIFRNTHLQNCQK